MNWISENKFLAGFIAFMIVGIGALGYLLFDALGKYTDVHNTYTNGVRTLDALQHQKPYPNPDNEKRYEAQGTDLQSAIDGLEQKLAQIQFPLDTTMTPQKFQAELQKAVSDEVAKAKSNDIQLSDKFSLGFGSYLNAPPVPAAAAPLDRELKAVIFIFDELLGEKGGVESIASEPVRDPLPEEKAPPEDEKKKKKTPPKTSSDLVEKSLVQVSFRATQDKLRKVLNDLVETNKQFYIVRLITIQNTNDKPVVKADAFKDRMGKDGVPNRWLGKEKLDVTLSLEIVNFNTPKK